MAHNDYEARIQAVLDRLENHPRTKTVAVNFNACRSGCFGFSAACVVLGSLPVVHPALTVGSFAVGVGALWLSMDKDGFRERFNGLLAKFGFSAPASKAEIQFEEDFTPPGSLLDMVIQKWGGYSTVNLSDLTALLKAKNDISDITHLARVNREIQVKLKCCGIESAFRKAKLSKIANQNSPKGQIARPATPQPKL